MIEQANESRHQAEGNVNKTKESVSQNEPIRASDTSRNDERDQKIQEEEDTARLRSERQSTQERNPE